MNNRYNQIAFFLLFVITGILFTVNITSCGKKSTASPQGLNVQYQVLNLSPDVGPIDLYIDFKKINGNLNPFIFSFNHGYFYLPSINTPFQFRPYVANTTTGTTIFSRNDILQPGLKYSLFISGSTADGTFTQTFTVDTAKPIPTIGRGKLRFVNVSPTATGGLDVYANGTLAFGHVPYKTVSPFIELPIGNYDVQINATGNKAILKDMPSVPIQDGRVYTIYVYGYTTRIDSAAFNAAILTNR
jgi:hypothetical protein